MGIGLDDQWMAAASNDKVMALVYTPHATAGDTVALKLILRTGTNSRIRTVTAHHGGAALNVGWPGGLLSKALVSAGDSYEEIPGRPSRT
jgi:hypothetical protein